MLKFCFVRATPALSIGTVLKPTLDALFCIPSAYFLHTLLRICIYIYIYLLDAEFNIIVVLETKMLLLIYVYSSSFACGFLIEIVAEIAQQVFNHAKVREVIFLLSRDRRHGRLALLLLHPGRRSRAVGTRWRRRVACVGSLRERARRGRRWSGTVLRD